MDWTNVSQKLRIFFLEEGKRFKNIHIFILIRFGENFAMLVHFFGNNLEGKL